VVQETATLLHMGGDDLVPSALMLPDREARAALISLKSRYCRLPGW
jgi:hypothetical protein